MLRMLAVAGLVLATAACSTPDVPAPVPVVVPASAWVNGPGQLELLAVQQDITDITSDTAGGNTVRLAGDGGALGGDAAAAALLPVPGDPKDYESAMTTLSAAGYDVASGDELDATRSILDGEQQLAAALQEAAIAEGGQ